MSLADHLRYLRAMAGGPDLQTIAGAIGLEQAGQIRQAEIRYRSVEDSDLITRLANYYNRPVEEFHWHNGRPRKHLTFYVARAMETGETISLTLRSGEELSGQVEWWDLASVGLRDEDSNLLVVQRHAIVDWPNAEETWWLEE